MHAAMAVREMLSCVGGGRHDAHAIGRPLLACGSKWCGGRHFLNELIKERVQVSKV